jgi:DNA-binding SARP family transcriptional activator
MDVLARQHAAAGRPADALAAAERLVAHEPLRESAHRVLMEALAALGEPGRAVAHYDALAALLDREVGARPARETQALRARLAA